MLQEEIPPPPQPNNALLNIRDQKEQKHPDKLEFLVNKMVLEEEAFRKHLC